MKKTKEESKTKKEVKKTKIKAIIFDVGGVLKIGRFSIMKFKVGDEESYHLDMSKYLQMSLDSWFDAIDKVYVDSFEGKIKEKEVSKIIAKNLGVDLQDLIKTSDKVFKKFFKKNKKLYKIAFDLKKRGYVVGILSDQWVFSKRVLTPREDVKGFSPVIISCDVGVRKPDVRIYKLLMKKLRKKHKGIKASEVLFIDNRDYNLKPARRLGMKVILFKNNKQVVREMGEFGLETRNKLI